MGNKYFGTDGIRGTVNQGNITGEKFFKFGLAAATYFKNQKRTKQIAIIAKDTRLSGYTLEPALVSGLASGGMHIFTLGPLPTNGLAMLTKSMKANMGIMITASHNPYYDNGLKLFGPDGMKLSDKIEKKLKNLWKNNIWLDSLSCSIHYKNLLRKRNRIIEKIDPIYFFKSIKNSTEIKNMKKSHMVDGVALTKFLFWLKKNFRKKKITEISAQKKLESFRKMNKTYKFPSFSTISGTGPNSAIIHYKASIKSNRTLKKGDLYLVDSGGQYSFGTTDVTRTISLDNNSKSIREIYTRILKGHIAVSDYKIRKNSKGSDIDRNARKSLKKIGLDYPHGTGHGVGYFLNVHEGPQSFSKNNKVNLKPGMIISNEPGYYKEGYFGIRIENLIYIKKNKFEELTMAPMEKDLIKKKMLNKKEIGWLNKYHTKVKKNLFRFMNLEEKANLIDACSPI